MKRASPGDADVIGVATGSAERLEEYLLQQLSTGSAALPLLPHAAAEALRLASDPHADIDELATLIETDPPIAARLLSFANSAVYGRSQKAIDARSAIIRLGVANARDLLFQVVYANAMFGMPRYHDRVAICFRKSVLAAIAARFIDDKLGGKQPYSYLCGLLHDVGVGRVYRILASKPPPIEGISAIERLVFRHHTTAGADLAQAWRLPDDIVRSCACHHDAPATLEGPVRLVAIADVLVRVAEQPAGGGCGPEDAALLDVLRTPGDVASAALEAIREAAGLL